MTPIRRLLDVPLDEADLAEHALRYARPKDDARAGALSAVVFRLRAEWFALPTRVFREVAPLRPVHSLPHRRDRIIEGVANIRGELVVCVALEAVLGLAGAGGRDPARARLAVIARDGDRFAFRADEVTSLHRFDAAELQPLPATLTPALAVHTRGVLRWRERTVALLDDALLFQTLGGHLA